MTDRPMLILRRLILLLSIAGTSYGQTLLAHAIARAASQTGTATTSAMNCTGASLLVVAASNFGQDSSTSVISSSPSNSWVSLKNQVQSAANVSIWYVANPNVSSTMTVSGKGRYIGI